ncbi:hypothetical protein WJX84_008694, partial [Apatococcus fuscideae]
ERGDKVGGQIGYSVRLDTRASACTQILFCTTGVLLRRLLVDSNLQDVTHVVVDEVHERSADSDLLLLLLRQLLHRPAACHLRILLMSATADAKAFADYFYMSTATARQSHQSGGAGTTVTMLTIPGFMHPVRDFHLEDVLELTGLQIRRGSRWAKKGGTSKHVGQDPQAPMMAQELPAWDAQRFSTPTWEGRNDLSEATRQSLQVVDEAIINFDLIEALIASIVETEQQDGPGAFWQGHQEAGSFSRSNKGSGSQAVLVFLPGAGEIDRLVRQLRNSPQLKRAAEGMGFLVSPLHGSLPPDQQARVFAPAPKGMKKIVVATNVAESSITIDDVTVVVDAGRAKEMRYGAGRSMARLQEGWISQASARQRRGRAGRVQPGVCFRLFSSTTASSFEAHAAPELLCQLPMDPRLGKTLLFGSMLGCCAPVLTIAAALAHGRPVFQSPSDRRTEADAAKKALCEGSAAAKSDHLAILAAFSRFHTALTHGGHRAASQACRDSFLSEGAMEAILAGRQDFAKKLADLGFITHSYAASINSDHSQQQSMPAHDTSSPDKFSHNARFIKAAICAGFYPAVLRVEHPTARFEKVQGGALERDADPAKLRFYDHTKGRVFMHPASINFHSNRFESGWLIYTEILETAKIYVRESSMVPVYALLLFSEQLRVSHETGMLQVGKFVKFKAPSRIGVLVRELRAELDRLLMRKVADPGFDLNSCKAIGVCRSLLASDGF